MGIILDAPVEPYRYLFAIGAVNAVCGAVVWLVYAAGLMPYPAVMHPILMSGGFLTSFGLGFLWTALPRFTHSDTTRFRDILPLLVTSLAAMASTLVGWISIAMIFHLLTVIQSLVFAERCFRRGQQTAPDSFVFIRVGLVINATCIGILVLQSFLQTSADASMMPFALSHFARSFFLKGFMLFLLIGVGHRLVPAIIGMPSPQKIDLHPRSSTILHSMLHGVMKSKEHWLLMTAFLGAFLIEALGEVRISASVFAVTFVWTALRVFRVTHRPDVSHPVALFVWCSVWSMTIAPLCIAVWPQAAIHLWHIMFIAALALVTIMVSLRVSISHSGFGVIHSEERKRYITWIGGLLLLTAAVRATIALTPAQAVSHYAYASLLWIIVIATWVKAFFRFAVMVEHTRVVELLRTTTTTSPAFPAKGR